MKLFKQAMKYGSTALVLAALSSQANAAIDVSAVLTSINELLVPVAAIGAAMLIVIISIKGWKLIRGAM